MPTYWVFLGYGAAFVLALLLLRFFHARTWYWHALSLVLAIIIGLMPTPDALATPSMNLLVGSLFLLLFCWGAAAPFFRVPHVK